MQKGNLVHLTILTIPYLFAGFFVLRTKIAFVAGGVVVAGVVVLVYALIFACIVIVTGIDASS